jgi:hypothetical protein
VYGAPANIISRTYRWICRGTHWLFSPASPGRESHRWCSGQLYAEAQRRYLESVSPYARRLFHQMAVPQVDAIDGLPPAVALQQQRGSPTTRSSVGSVTTLSNLLRMLYSRAGDYPRDQPLLYAESFSTNTVEGACPECHGIGGVHQVTEKSMVPDDSLTIRQRAIAAWPTARGQNLRDILVTLGYDVDRPWRELPKKDRNWILFTEEQPTVPVYAGYTPAEVRRALKRKDEPTCQGTFTSARKHVLQTFDVFVGAPLLTLATRQMPRKTVLLALMAIFTLGNAACALAPNYALLMAARVLTSLAHGTFFGVGSVEATSLVAEDKRASAIATMFTGLTVATLLGVPFGAWSGLMLGWRAAFWAVTAIGVIAFAAVAALVPGYDGNDDRPISLADGRSALQRVERGCAASSG